MPLGKPFYPFPILLILLIFVLVASQTFSFTLKSFKQNGKKKEVPLLTTGKPEGCLFCHDEKVEEKVHAREMLGCSSCHLGNPLTVDYRAAHKGVVKNPSDLRIVHKTCGQANCHPQDLKKVKNSLMATNHGILVRLLKVFGEEAILKEHPNISVEDLYSLRTSSLALDYFKKLCGSCHLFLEKGRLPDFLAEKGGGCSACHLVGKKEDLKKRKLHPRLTAKIPLEKCVLCHNRSGRIGFTYQGLYEDEQSGAGEVVYIDGRKLRKIKPDVHYKAGLHCIDCHTRDEVMGNGTFYRKIEDALQVDCETCHLRKGLTKAGTRLANIVERDGKVFQKGKVDERWHLVKALSKDCQDKYHRRLSCSACHAKYVPQCYGCHVRYDPRERHLDKILARETKGLWEEHESYRRIDEPTLAVKKDKIVVVTPG